MIQRDLFDDDAAENRARITRRTSNSWTCDDCGKAYPKPQAHFCLRQEATMTPGETGWHRSEPKARARRTDPETSHEAAKSVVELRKRQQAVLEVLKDGPATDEELVGNYPAFGWEEADYPKQSPSGLRTRRSELVALGMVRHSGQFKLTKSGRRTRVWEVV